MLLILYLLVVAHVCASQENGVERKGEKSSSSPSEVVSSEENSDLSSEEGGSEEVLDDEVIKPSRRVDGLRGGGGGSETDIEEPDFENIFMAKKLPYFRKHEPAYQVLGIMTSIFGSVFILGPMVVSFLKLEDAGMLRVFIMITSFSFWLFWMIVYIAQINPLLGPRLSNSTLLWMSRLWGRAITDESMVLRSAPRETFSDLDESS